MFLFCLKCFSFVVFVLKRLAILLKLTLKLYFYVLATSFYSQISDQIHNSLRQYASEFSKSSPFQLIHSNELYRSLQIVQLVLLRSAIPSSITKAFLLIFLHQYSSLNPQGKQHQSNNWCISYKLSAIPIKTEAQP